MTVTSFPRGTDIYFANNMADGCCNRVANRNVQKKTKQKCVLIFAIFKMSEILQTPGLGAYLTI